MIKIFLLGLVSTLILSKTDHIYSIVKLFPYSFKPEFFLLHFLIQYHNHNKGKFKQKCECINQSESIV